MTEQRMVSIPYETLMNALNGLTRAVEIDWPLPTEGDARGIVRREIKELAEAANLKPCRCRGVFHCDPCAYGDFT